MNNSEIGLLLRPHETTTLFPLEEANIALKKLKDSEIEARAVLIP